MTVEKEEKPRLLLYAFQVTSNLSPEEKYSKAGLLLYIFQTIGSQKYQQYPSQHWLLLYTCFRYWLLLYIFQAISSLTLCLCIDTTRLLPYTFYATSSPGEMTILVMKRYYRIHFRQLVAILEPKYFENQGYYHIHFRQPVAFSVSILEIGSGYYHIHFRRLVAHYLV